MNTGSLAIVAALVTLLAVCVDASSVHPSGCERDLNVALSIEPNEQLARLQQVSDSDVYLLRTFKSPAHTEAARKIKTWMELAGMRSWVDSIGNVHGELRGPEATHGAIVLGSHYDTVRDAGAYDGTLGIVTAVAAVKAMLLSSCDAATAASVKETDGWVDVRGIASSFVAGPGRRVHVRVVAFTDEEGMRFHTTFLGSRALTGQLTPEILAATDAAGVSVAASIGLPDDPEGRERALGALAMPAGSVRAYVEAHMEQGPVLEAAARPIGIVRAISGQSRLQVQVVGEQGHAGTVPMHLRKDPLRAASRLIDAIGAHCSTPPRTTAATLAAATHTTLQRLHSSTHPMLRDLVAAAAQQLPPAAQAWFHLRWLQLEQAAAQPYLVCTVGGVDIWPRVSNVIPGAVNFTVDIRSDSDDARGAVEAWLRQAVAADCDAHGMRCGVAQLHAAVTQHADMDVRDVLSTAAARAAARSAAGAAPPLPPVLTSGAGHDALAMAEVVPMGMLFVRCRGGVSHSPKEFVLPEDVAEAATVLLEFLLDTA
eukprot:jgi/Ulvmu1/3450/UM016_0070.1